MKPERLLELAKNTTEFDGLNPTESRECLAEITRQNRQIAELNFMLNKFRQWEKEDRKNETHCEPVVLDDFPSHFMGNY